MFPDFSGSLKIKEYVKKTKLRMIDFKYLLILKRFH